MVKPQLGYFISAWYKPQFGYFISAWSNRNSVNPPPKNRDFTIKTYQWHQAVSSNSSDATGTVQGTSRRLICPSHHQATRNGTKRWRWLICLQIVQISVNYPLFPLQMNSAGLTDTDTHSPAHWWDTWWIYIFTWWLKRISFLCFAIPQEEVINCCGNFTTIMAGRGDSNFYLVVLI